MSFDVYWRIPMAGDRSSWRNHPKRRGDWSPPIPGSLAPSRRDGEPDGLSYVEHVVEIARATEAAGFVGGLLPSFPQTDDPWIVAAAVARATTTYRFMVAFQPGFLHPVHAARMSATFQRLSGGRLLFNIITGGGGPAQLWWGDPTPHDDRYARTTEFLDVFAGVWDGGPFEHHGRFYDVTDGGLPEPLAGQPRPEIYFSGSSAAAIEAVGRHADYYLSWLEHPDDLRAKFDAVRATCEALGRTAKFSVRAHVVARPTEEEAWREVRLGWERIDPEAVRQRNARKSGDSVGAARQLAYQGTSLERYEDLIVAPNIWAGISYLGDHPTVGLVGSYAQVAERLNDLVELGADSLILSGLPHLEEAYRVGEEVLPLFGGARRPTPELATQGAAS
ncbi:MAG TPA: LLM class flavin-dependent oxidoreductase [Acidimicrobiales bacterium]